MATYTYLSETFLNKIRSHELPEQELASYHAEILKDYKKNGKVWLVVTVLVMLGSINGVSAVAGMSESSSLPAVLGVLLIVGGVMYLSKLAMIDMKKRQFTKALKVGYPELEDKYGKKSFRILG